MKSVAVFMNNVVYSAQWNSFAGQCVVHCLMRMT